MHFLLFFEFCGLFMDLFIIVKFKSIVKCMCIYKCASFILTNFPKPIYITSHPNNIF